jgi:hypothetical protein
VVHVIAEAGLTPIAAIHDACRAGAHSASGW